MAGFALGVLGWVPAAALACDVNLIVMARDGRDRWDYDALSRQMALKGVKLPPYDPPPPPTREQAQRSIKANLRALGAAAVARNRKSGAKQAND